MNRAQLAALPADLPMQLGQRLPRPGERTGGSLLGREALHQFERGDHVARSTVQATVTGCPAANNGVSHGGVHNLPLRDVAASATPAHADAAGTGSEQRAQGAAGVTLPPDEPLPDGWRYGPWVVLADVPPETVVIPKGAFYRSACGGQYGTPLHADVRLPSNHDFRARSLQGWADAIRVLHRVEA